jgi:hypothetical protein
LNQRQRTRFFSVGQMFSMEQELADKTVSPLYPILIGKFVYTIPIAENTGTFPFPGCN